MCQTPKNMAFDLFQKLGIDFLLFVLLHCSLLTLNLITYFGPNKVKGFGNHVTQPTPIFLKSPQFSEKPQT